MHIITPRSEIKRKITHYLSIGKRAGLPVDEVVQALDPDTVSVSEVRGLFGRSFLLTSCFNCGKRINMGISMDDKQDKVLCINCIMQANELVGEILKEDSHTKPDSIT